MRIRIQLFYLNADPDPRSQTNADPDSGLTLKSQTIEFFLHKKYTYKVGKHTYEGTKDILKGRKPGLFVNFGQFTIFFYILLDPDPQIPNMDPDPDSGQPNQCGSVTPKIMMLTLMTSM